MIKDAVICCMLIFYYI